MVIVQGEPEATTSVAPENFFFQVFLGFRKPDGSVSLFAEGVSNGCEIYAKLAKIFARKPRDIYESMRHLADGKGDAFMQEYLTVERASQAVANASLFAHTSMCYCFCKQEGFFYITEIKK